MRTKWTHFPHFDDARYIFVSSSMGSDGNDGLRYQTPVKTLERAKSLMRNRFPDAMFLRKGDTWTESLGHWKMSGRSVLEPMIIGSYGTQPDRPKLMTGDRVAS